MTTEATGAGAASSARSPSVCFYEWAHFEGAKVCGGPKGEAGTLPADWDNRISSIEITGTFEVKVCTEANFAGDCDVFTTSAPSLPAEFDNKISSWKAE